MGYQDVIVVLYGYAPEQGAVTGFRVLESRETPGLGDKIDVDPGFLANFERLDGRADRGPLRGRCTRSSRSSTARRPQPWQIDAITGATVSSIAVAKILRESTGFWVPRICASISTTSGRRR